MSATETLGHRRSAQAQGRRSAAPRPGHVRRQHRPARDGRDGRRAQPVRARADHLDRHRGRGGADGVVAVFTGADLRDDWKAAMPCAWPVTEDMKNPEHFPLAVDEVNYQGDGVAVVIADTRAHAVDAAELVEVDYEPLDVIVDVEAAAQDGATLVHEDLGTNVSLRLDARERRRSTTDADVIVKHRYVQPPLIPNAIEPRGVVARPEPRRRRHALVGDAGAAHPARPHRGHARDVRDEAARDRARRRRRLRLEARRLRGGAARGRARAPPRHGR